MSSTDCISQRTNWGKGWTFNKPNYWSHTKTKRLRNGDVYPASQSRWFHL